MDGLIKTEDLIAKYFPQLRSAVEDWLWLENRPCNEERILESAIVVDFLLSHFGYSGCQINDEGLPPGIIEERKASILFMLIGYSHAPGTPQEWTSRDCPF